MPLRPNALVLECPSAHALTHALTFYSPDTAAVLARRPNALLKPCAQHCDSTAPCCAALQMAL
jgi:hypothetical protein